ncbi:MAG: ABC transporter substrate-binding protein [Chloroflexota bacterium]|nr:MAG: ABC transporter substrate-binding protein [Chloroflexota bacterium]
MKLNLPNILRRQRTLTATFILLVIAVLALAACGAPAGAPAPGDASAPSQIVVIIPEEPASLNQYHAVAAIVRQVADAVSAPLAAPNAQGEFVPVLAAELPTVANGGVSEDYLTVTWKLRPDLKWSDGEPITSDDIKFTWEAVSNPASGNVLSLGFEKIASIETPDELTAVITYSELNQAYLQQFMYGILPRHATGAPEEMLQWAWNRNPVSGGPYVVTEWNAGESIVMDRNPHYYLEGQPYIDRVIFTIVPDPGAQMAMMAKGEAHVQLWPGEVKEVYDAQMNGMAAIQEIPGQWNMTLFFNLSRPFDNDPGAEPPHPILGDLRVRQAIAHAIDYETIVTAVNPGVIETATPFAYGWYQCDQERKYLYDPETAKALLEEAGWVEGPDGIRVAQGAAYAEDGTRLRVQLNGYTNFQQLVKLEEALAEMFKAVGIETTIQNDDFSIIFGSFDDGAPRQLGNFDILVYDTSLPMEPHASIANTYMSTAIPTADNPAGNNASRWVNARADELIQAAGATVDLDARRAAYCELSDLIATELPRLNLYLFTEGYGASNRLSGYEVNMWGSLSWDIQNWRLD